MDCRNFKDYLDSYLSQELAVETNHAILRHAEHCSDCRCEMTARRRMREQLKLACSREKLSDEACERLRAALHAEAQACKEAEAASGPGKGFFARLFNLRFSIPVAATAAMVILASGGFGLYLLIREPQAPVLSRELIDQSFGDHRTCASFFATRSGPLKMPESAKNDDPAYADLEKIAAPGAQDLELRSAHVCSFKERRFAHLVYMRDSNLISLLVTQRDGRALDAGMAPLDDGEELQIQKVERDGVVLGAYQTGKRVVLIISTLPKEENSRLAERLAKPVADHLRNFERVATARSRKTALRSGKSGETAKIF